MDTLLATALALAIIVPLVWRYWKKSGVQLRPEVALVSCPRCGKNTDGASSLCLYCHTPLAVWRGGDPSGENTSGSPRPLINASLCIGCGACIDVCPEKGALGLENGKAKLINPDLCKSHGDCAPACPTSGITLLAGGAKQVLRAPHTNSDFETNIPGLFVIGELGGLGLIKTAINEGRRVADVVRKRLGARLTSSPAVANAYEAIVVGGGPAGLSAALSFHDYGVNYLVLEQGEIASTIRHYPRNKFLMEEPVEVPRFGKLLMNDTTKEALLQVWDEIVETTGVRIETNQRVEQIEHLADHTLIKVATKEQEFYAPYVVLATGKRGSPRKLGVPGEELSKVTYRLIEAESYENCFAAVAGGGDSAVEAALALARSGRNTVSLIHRGSDFRRLRERNSSRLKEAEASGQLKVIRNAIITEIFVDSLEIQQNSQRMKQPNQFLFVLVGGESPEAFLQKIGIEIIERVISN
jgi:thioredoxin reductase/NAD-dependent dihydropyrimidine dehydrogenase PreA subunit